MAPTAGERFREEGHSGPIYLTDKVIEQLGRLFLQTPECGGALLGLPGRSVVTDFIFDEEARVTRSSFTPSRWLAEAVRQAEVMKGLQFLGIAHSHPGSFSSLSGDDRTAISNALADNRQLACYVAPIATLVSPATRKSNQLAVAGGGTLTCWVGERNSVTNDNEATS